MCGARAKGLGEWRRPGSGCPGRGQRQGPRLEAWVAGITPGACGEGRGWGVVRTQRSFCRALPVLQSVDPGHLQKEPGCLGLCGLPASLPARLPSALADSAGHILFFAGADLLQLLVQRTSGGEC